MRKKWTLLAHVIDLLRNERSVYNFSCGANKIYYRFIFNLRKWHKNSNFEIFDDFCVINNY